MILVLSQRNHEPSTLEVQEWLNYYKANYIRLNGKDVIENISASMNNIFFLQEQSRAINVIWFRRWFDESLAEQMSLSQFPSNEIDFSYKNILKYFSYIQGEIRVVNSVFFRSLKEKFWLSHPRDLMMDKLEVLEIAGSLGLNIPNYLIATSKKEVIKFKRNQKIITKNLREVQFFTANDNKYSLCTKTVEVDDVFISSLEESFFPSFFQIMIPKQYELRIFFLGEEFFPMAIFSQLDDKTKVDFRNYNLAKPNRCVPYILEKKLKLKLVKLSKALKLETGSFDLIKSTNNKYYFLEVNPIGQFGMTSIPCNYHIEKKIAKFLIKKDEKIEKSKHKFL